MHIKHKSLIHMVEKILVNNYMFKIDIEKTRTRCEICSKLTIKDPKRNDLHYLDHFHCFQDLQKTWNLVHILKLA